MSEQVTDPLAVLLSGGALAITTLLGIVTKLISSRAHRVEEKVSSLEENHNTLWRGMVGVDGRVKVNEAEIASLKKDTLTRELFEERTTGQDKKLERITDKVEKIDHELAGIPAMRPRQNTRRDDR
jgi:uncharacterized protein YdcH (DUF465 family)